MEFLTNSERILKKREVFPRNRDVKWYKANISV